MSEAKIRLSQTEKELVSNAALILTKNGILKKVNLLLASLQEKQQEHIASHSERWPVALVHSSPKISRGENYQGLPYLVLDYPRLFNQDNILTVRTLFWWGNFFSITLHLSGNQKSEREVSILSNFETLADKGFYFSVNNDQWEHHFETSNYQLLSQFSRPAFEAEIRQRSFIKLAIKIPLQHWDEAEEILLDYFKEMMGWLSN